MYVKEYKNCKIYIFLFVLFLYRQRKSDTVK